MSLKTKSIIMNSEIKQTYSIKLQKFSQTITSKNNNINNRVKGQITIDSKEIPQHFIVKIKNNRNKSHHQGKLLQTNHPY